MIFILPDIGIGFFLHLIIEKLSENLYLDDSDVEVTLKDIQSTTLPSKNVLMTPIKLKLT
jgi:hypothetical protein